MSNKRSNIPNKRSIVFDLVKEQKGRCYWCTLPFNTPYDIKSSDMYVTKWLTPVLDHYIPYSFTQKHEKENFVASCEICNRIKSSSFPIVRGSEDYIRSKIIERFVWRLEKGKIIIFDEDLKIAEKVWKEVDPKW